MKKGTVKFFDKTRGFGFITEDETKKDTYFTVADVEEKEQLETGDKVEFEVKKTERGIKATKITKTK